MTHPHDSEDMPMDEPIPVRIVNAEKTQSVAPEFSTWETVQVPDALNGGPVRVIGRNEHRSSLTIMVVGAGAIRIGGKNKVQNNGGGTMNSGQSITIKGAPEVWAVAAVLASPSAVTVVDERYS